MLLLYISIYFSFFMSLLLMLFHFIIGVLHDGNPVAGLKIFDERDKDCCSSGLFVFDLIKACSESVVPPWSVFLH